MKTITKIVTVTLCISALHVQAQNVFPANGNAGIGTNTPLNPLHVKTISRFPAYFENSSADIGAATDAFVIFANKYGQSQISSWQNFGARIGSRSIAGGGQGNVYFTTGSDVVRMMLQQSTGNVGIGTEAPAQKLHIINSAGNSVMRLQGKGDDVSSFLDIYSGSNKSGLWKYGFGGIELATQGAVRLQVAENGNVGIGTTTPAYKLDVNNPKSRVASNGYDGVTFEQQPYPNQGMLLFSSDRTGYTFSIGNKRKSDGNVLPIITMYDQGNVGIGTTTPSAPLTIAGPNKAFMDFTETYSNKTWRLVNRTDQSFAVENISGGGAAAFVINQSGAVGIGTTLAHAQLHITSPSGYATFMIGNNDINGFHITKQTEDNSFNIWSGIIGAGTNRLKILSNGNIGIGTSYPGAYKLAVEGKLGAREIDVKQGSWADFVFKDDYKLKSLEEVEKFINKNKHLPDVPSEKEVLENGINLGKMDATLLQKIEELTLYMIELKKENYKQNEAINDLKDQNKLLTDLLKSK